MRSKNSLLRLLVINPEVPVTKRIAALQKVKASRRFLERLIRDKGLPDKLRASATKHLLKLWDPIGKPKPAQPPISARTSPTPPPSQVDAGAPLPTPEPINPEEAKERLKISNPVLYDVLYTLFSDEYTPETKAYFERIRKENEEETRS
jgi:hypothetical protein